MQNIDELINNLKSKSDQRFDDFNIKNVAHFSVENISSDAYLEKPMWLGGSEKFICVAIDLNGSSQISNERRPETMAKIYDYFTQNIVDIFSNQELKADYIDVKGDGVFGIYEGENAIEKAFAASVTFKTLFNKVIEPKFRSNYGLNLKCKIAIDRNRILVKKIGNRSFYNEVWAGRLVNSTYKLLKLVEDIKERDIEVEKGQSVMILSPEIHRYLSINHNDYAILSCGCVDGVPNGQKDNIWSDYDYLDKEKLTDERAHYSLSCWCDTHGQEYYEAILDKEN